MHCVPFSAELLLLKAEQAHRKLENYFLKYVLEVIHAPHKGTCLYLAESIPVLHYFAQCLPMDRDPNQVILAYYFRGKGPNTPPLPFYTIDHDEARNDVREAIFFGREESPNTARKLFRRGL